MNPLEFLFELIQKYVPVSAGRFVALRKSAEEWYVSKEVEDNMIGKRIKEYGEKWWVQLLLCVAFIFAMRWVQDFLSGKSDSDDSKRV